VRIISEVVFLQAYNSM